MGSAVVAVGDVMPWLASSSRFGCRGVRLLSEGAASRICELRFFVDLTDRFRQRI